MTKPSTHPGRVAVSLLAATLIGCLAGIVSLPMLGGTAMRPPGFGPFMEVWLFIWVVTLPVSLVFGALTHFALLRLRLWPVTAYTIAGMLLGPLSLIVWDVVINQSMNFNWLSAELTWLGVIVGGTTALAFRVMVHKSSDTPSFPPEGTRPY